ncbi:MAG: PHP domain-containing protein [Clostridia bacterium]|nr:PHP domain-containing protein [Clostridia bacterium]
MSREKKFDFHSHSNVSDGTFTPSELVASAVNEGVRLLALTDHDNIGGVAEAMEAGKRLGLPVLPAVEMDNEWHHELHIIGLDIDPENPTLNRSLEIARERREKRNRTIYRKLKDAGYPVEEFIHRPADRTMKLHIAKALIEMGVATDVRDAFAKYLRPGQVGYYTEQRLTPKQVIDMIHIADGLPVLAHPCHIRDNPHSLVRELTDLGLMGIEAYYPSSTVRQTEMYVSLAHQLGLFITCGSDFHGANRPGVDLGCAWQDVPDLWRTFDTLTTRMNS